MKLTAAEKGHIRLMLLRDVKDPKQRKRLIQVASALASDETEPSEADDLFCSVLYTFMQPERAEQFETLYKEMQAQGAFS